MKDLSILNKFVPDYDENFRSGKYEIQEMPLLDSFFHTILEKQNNFEDVYLVACQHLLEPQLKMFQYFVKIGIKNIIILPKVYSVNLEIAKSLEIIGCNVFHEALEFQVSEDFDVFHQQQCEKVCNYVKERISKKDRLVVLDDGGALLKTFAKEWKDFPLIYGVEQTASGKRKLLDKPLPFYVNSVASSIEKISIETDYIIRHSLNRMKQYFDDYNINKSAKILVIGKGPIGKTLIHSLKSESYLCDGYDITDSKSFPILDEYDVIIGATGVNSINLDQLMICKRKKYLISISSSDREFPAPEIRNLSTSGIEIHDTFIYKNIHLVNGGFPITFKGEKYECYPLEMDVTMVKLSEAILNHLLEKNASNQLVNQVFAKKMFIKKDLALLIVGLILSIHLLIWKVVIKSSIEEISPKFIPENFNIENWNIGIIIGLIMVCCPFINQIIYWWILKRKIQKALDCF